MENELKDRFGPLPAPALNLLRLLHFKKELTELKVPRMASEGGNIYLLMPFIKGSVSARDLKMLSGPAGYRVNFEGNRLTFVGILGERNWLDRLQDLLARLRTIPSFQPILEFTSL